MASHALVLAGIFSLIGSFLFVRVAMILHARPVSERAHGARDAFSTWWYALAGTNLATALSTLLFAGGVTTVPLHAALLYLRVALLALGLWGLLYYLIYLYTGRQRWRMRLAVFYVFVALLILAIYAAAQPAGIEARAGELVFLWEDDPSSLERVVALLFVVVPIFGATLAYASLFFRTRSPAHRYRIAIVSVSFLLWVSLFFATRIGGHGSQPALGVVLRAVALLVPVLVLVAYRPPRFVPARYVDEVSADAGPGASAGAGAGAR